MKKALVVALLIVGLGVGMAQAYDDDDNIITPNRPNSGWTDIDRGDNNIPQAPDPSPRYVPKGRIPSGYMIPGYDGRLPGDQIPPYSAYDEDRSGDY